PVSFLPCCLSHALTPAVSTLSLHDALPIFEHETQQVLYLVPSVGDVGGCVWHVDAAGFVVLCEWHVWLVVPVLVDEPELDEYVRSGEHTSELQSRENLVCRLLLVKKKTILH